MTFGLKRLSENEKQGVKIAFRFMLRHPATVSIMLIAGVAAAGFEGGTLGLLGLAVSILSGESAGFIVDLPDFVKQFIDDGLTGVRRISP